MTRDEADTLADKLIELVEAATQAVRDGKSAVAADLLQQALTLAATMPKKETH